jgi:hypothetical protein
LLVFKNKSDVPGAMTEGDVREVGSVQQWERVGARWRANDD